MTSHGIGTVRVGRALAIASKYGVDVVIAVGTDGLRRNGAWALISGYDFHPECDYVSLVGANGTVFRMGA